jgi:hypothetical protein
MIVNVLTAVASILRWVSDRPSVLRWARFAVILIVLALIVGIVVR